MPFGCVTITPTLPPPRSTVDGPGVTSDGAGVGLGVVDGGAAALDVDAWVESVVLESEAVGADGAAALDEADVFDVLGAAALDTSALEGAGAVDAVGEVDGTSDVVTPTSCVDPVGCADRVTPTIVPAAATATAAPTAFATIRFMRPIIAGSGDICKMTNLPESIAELARMFVDLRADVHRIEQKLDALPAVFVPREIFAIRQAEHDDLLRRVTELERDAISKRAVYTLVGVLAALATAIGSILAVVLR